MGASNSRDDSYRQSSASRATSSSWDNYQYPQSGYSQSDYPQSAYPQDSFSQQSYSQGSYDYPPRPTVPAYGPPQHRSSSSQNYGSGGQRRAELPRRTLDKQYSRIADNYKSLEQVTDALATAGLESSNLILGIDFTKSNEWTGKRSFNGRSLHHIGSTLNPYEQAISIIGKTLAAFDEDNMIPCFGFGDASTHDQDVFSFYPDEKFCNGFEEVLSRYREILPHIKLAGPTSFAPVIEMATTIVEQSRGQYHVLVIIADGQVTRSVDTQQGHLSPQEQKTVEAIVQASKFPLSIILVGVGDGPWDMMKEFDDNIPARDFDNFQFVNFTEIMSKNVPHHRKETEFALAALMEIPSQYKATMELGLLGGKKSNSPGRVPLPPPVLRPPTAASFQKKSSAYYDYDSSYDTSASAPSYDTSASAPSSASASTYDNQICPICLTNRKDMAFGCGHQTCCECGPELELCPICRTAIQTRIKLY